MTIDELRGALRAAPFRPFTIRIADGRFFEVHHPDFVLITPSGRTAFVLRPDDSFSIVDVRLMTEIEVSPAQPTQAGGE